MKKNHLFVFLPIVFAVLILIYIKKTFVNFACPEAALLKLFSIENYIADEIQLIIATEY